MLWRPLSLALLLVALLPAVALPAPPEWRVVSEQSRLGFTGTQAGSPFNGSFKAFEARVRFDPDDLAASRVEVTIDMATAETGARERDDAVRGDDWFAVARHPKATFRTVGFRRLAADRYEADADLTIRDTTRRVTLPFTLTIADGQAHAVGDVTIKRTDFGVGQGQWASGQWVGLDVTIRIDIRAAAAN
jgi:polyisoprenoid-binding protein YceI